MNRIFITGDTHLNEDIEKLNRKNFPQQDDLTKDDYLIILGDVGMAWFGDGRDQLTIDWYLEKNYTTLFIDGNHENHAKLNSYPVISWHGGKIHKLGHSAYHLMRGQVFDIAGKKFFTMGGGYSIDRHTRRLNVDYWEEELPNIKEFEEGIANLQKHNMTVDYVLTHDCARIQANKIAEAKNKLLFDNHNIELSQFFTRLEYDFGLNFKHWYFGHYHADADADDKHTCLYNTVIEI